MSSWDQPDDATRYDNPASWSGASDPTVADRGYGSSTGRGVPAWGSASAAQGSRRVVAPNSSYDRPTGPLAPVGRQGSRGAPPSPPSSKLPLLVSVAALAVAVAAVALVLVDRNNSSPQITAASSGQVTTSATAAPTKSSGTPTSATSTTPSTTAAPSTTTTVPSDGQSLPPTAGVEQSLVSSFIADNPGGVGLSAADINGVVTNSVYYGKQPSTSEYWALASFQPSSTLQADASTAAGQAKMAVISHKVAVFSWQSGPLWTLLGTVAGSTCPSMVPPAVLASWNLCGLHPSSAPSTS
jgi:hypothetical protein